MATSIQSYPSHKSHSHFAITDTFNPSHAHFPTLKQTSPSSLDLKSDACHPASGGLPTAGMNPWHFVSRLLLTTLLLAAISTRAADAPLTPLYPGITPACPCESLTNFSLPNTTV